MKTPLARDSVEAKAATAARFIRATGKTCARTDAEDLIWLVVLHDEVDQAVRTAIAGLRSDGYTWASIGAALGVTRQAALMRWGDPVSTTEA